ncbi:metalloregulator ArsR/SmtB family transcription factor [Bacillaceae bacterium IKA-2]|nr:metalloregulator ArsR/SmtB family transcription factor [Bacillaceae bacterium IKA-2]
MRPQQWSPLSELEAKLIEKKFKNDLPLLSNKSEVTRKVELFKALGDETRLRIIGMLSVRDLCMCEIVFGLDGANSTISHHLKLLEKGEVISSRKEGKFTVYQLNKQILPLLQLD